MVLGSLLVCPVWHTSKSNSGLSSTAVFRDPTICEASWITAGYPGPMTSNKEFCFCWLIAEGWVEGWLIGDAELKVLVFGIVAPVLTCSILHRCKSRVSQIGRSSIIYDTIRRFSTIILQHMYGLTVLTKYLLFELHDLKDSIIFLELNIIGEVTLELEGSDSDMTLAFSKIFKFIFESYPWYEELQG